MKTFYAYVYRDPSRDNEPIYVGKGSGRRAWAHLKPIKRRHPFTQRLNKMIRENVQPDIEIIACADEAEAFKIETELIAKFGRKDLRLGTLLNMSDGGEGPSGRIFSNEVRAKMSAGQRRVQGIAQNRPEVKAERVKIATALMADEGRRKQISESCKKTLADPEVKKRCSDAQKRIAATEEGRRQRSQCAGRIWVNDGTQTKRVTVEQFATMQGFIRGRL